MREEGSGTRAVVERAFAEQLLTPKPVMSLGSIEAIKRAVAAGIGVAVVSSLTVTLEVKTGTLAILPVQNLKIMRPLHVLRLRGRQMSRAAQAFKAALHDSSVA